LRESGTVRVIDSLIVYKDANGQLEAEHLGNLSDEDVIELDSKVAALIGLGFDDAEGAMAGAELGIEAGERGENLLAIDDDDWDVLADIPNDTAAAIVMLEHHWAVGLRDAVARAGGFRISDGFISPLDLVGIGLLAGEEARILTEMESSNQVSSS
jgi:hypothetical protein